MTKLYLFLFLVCFKLVLLFGTVCFYIALCPTRCNADYYDAISVSLCTVGSFTDWFSCL